MRKRRSKLTRVPAADLGEQMYVTQMAFGPAMLDGDPVLLMQCQVLVSGECQARTVTLGIPGSGVDKFLIAAQNGVSDYKAHQAREGH